MQPDHQAILDQYREYATRCKTPACAESGAAQVRRQREGYLESIRIANEFLDQVLAPVIAAFEERSRVLREEQEER